MRYWIKLYTEIVHDPKMGRLTDRQFRTCINLFAMAGSLDQEGELPAQDDIAWQLRMAANDLQDDLEALAAVDILEINDNGLWHIRKWAERQSRAPSAAPDKVLQRVHDYRQRQRNEDVTTLQPSVTTLKRTVTPPETEKKRKEAEKSREEAETPATPSATSGRASAQRLTELNAKVPAPQRIPIVNALLDLSGLRSLAEGTSEHGARVLADAHECAVGLWQMGYQTPERLSTLSDAWAQDWRGAKGTRPTLKQVLEIASSLQAPALPPGRNGSKPDPGKETAEQRRAKYIPAGYEELIEQ